MKVVNGFFSGKKWVVNSKGKRVTYKSIDYLSLYKSNLVYTVKKDWGNVIWVFRKDTEDLIYHGIATRCDYLFGKYFALSIYKDKKTLIVDENYNIRYVPYISNFDAGQGLAIICDNETYSYIKDDFSLAINEKYLHALPFNTYGFAIVETLDKVRQVIDIHGNVVIDKAYDVTGVFLNERFILTYKESEGHGIIDINGKRIFSNFYSNISILNENYFLIEKNGKQGIADLTGKILLEPIYDEIMETQDKYVVRDFSKIEIEKTQSVNK